MNVHLHIERLVLDGLALEPFDGQALQDAVEMQLMTMLGTAVPGSIRTGFSVPSVYAPTLHLRTGDDARLMGARIGDSIYAALARGV